jgi:Zn-finger nucleic acid-binding protein
MSERTLKCPRDATQLDIGQEMNVEVDRCPTCRGAWYDNYELELLESTVGDADQRKGMIDYAKRESELDCIVCGKRMRAFNYRAYNLELDACLDDHGFWMDAGESDRVLEVMKERVAGLQRSGEAEAAWNKAKRGEGPGFFGRLFGKK